MINLALVTLKCEKPSMDNKRQKQEQKGDSPASVKQDNIEQRPTEIGGPRGPEPTRYGDWERRGRCIDF